MNVPQIPYDTVSSIEPGDLVLGRPPGLVFQFPGTFVRANVDRIVFVAFDGREFYCLNKDLFWVKQRTAKITAVQKSNHIDDFPHSCTLCGRKAYVGLFEIIHQDETIVANCTAKRG